MTPVTSALVGKALQSVPCAATFPTVDQMVNELHRVHAQRPDITRLRRVGTSRLGDPINELVIGTFDRHALVFGGVHPNEPIGNITALHLIDTLLADQELRDQLGYTWHIVPCIDPDGMRLNEGWFEGPLTRAAYGRKFYRPAPNEQVEWTFPFSYKSAYFDQMLPETVALMRLIDDAKPAFMCSLHNGEYGGVYYYLSRQAPEIYSDLHMIAAALDLPLNTGEPEVPYVERYAPAIFSVLRSEDQYDFIESAGLDPSERHVGSSSAAYASKYGTLTLMTEVPYWVHPDADDNSVIDQTYSEVLREQAAGLRDAGEMLAAALSAVATDLSIESPFIRASRSAVHMLARAVAQNEHRADQPEAHRRATVSERFGCLDTVHVFRLRYGGMLLRALNGELAIGNATPVIRREQESLDGLYEKWAGEADAMPAADTIPYGTLAAVQFAAILVTATYAAQ